MPARNLPCLLCILLAQVIAGIADAATITISCGSVGQELELCRSGAQAWARKTGHAVQLVSTPASSSERLGLYQQLLGARAQDVDVFQIDVVWPGILASHLIDLAPYAGARTEHHHAAIVSNNTVRGKLVAMPWFSTVPMLYYRKDLLDRYGLPPPQTWEELTATATHIQDAQRAAGDARLWGFVWQGRVYEGLTCNALEWIASYAGGAIVETDGRVSIANPRAARALTLAAGWVGTISPRGVLNYTEEESRGVFQSGFAVFMRNWPYAWPLVNGEDSPVRGKVGVVPLPAGEDGAGAGTLGGEQLAVSRYSRHPALAADLVMYLTSPAEQKRRAIVAAFNPTLPALYADAEILHANPFYAQFAEAFASAIPRPSAVTGARYNRVSSAFQYAVHAVLSDQADASTALHSLERNLMRLSRGGRW